MVFGALYYKTLAGKKKESPAKGSTPDRSEPLLPTSSAQPAELEVGYETIEAEKQVLLSCSPRTGRQ